MCPECGGEYGHSPGCPEAARYEAQRRMRLAVQYAEDAARSTIEMLSGVRNVAWACLDLIGNPGPATKDLDPRALAREALAKIAALESRSEER